MSYSVVFLLLFLIKILKSLASSDQFRPRCQSSGLDVNANLTFKFSILQFSKLQSSINDDGIHFELTSNERFENDSPLVTGKFH